ncbi:COG4-domain-containing protein [Hyphopichia burtonii NRRL Y-1933]|uniref:Conserved oligomeric Golgi complex subunit 4 n=1 Tax=Hyphopichia burtonii NRRL Y-1933 TaxID=984485 RepID=A0A1E4RSB7_9ASCO|nr:COG4-domain-containing protein [Hyphopichia burtonii NRRL Y-1933]ODV70170.1 COG4-domain-containing protein [Hyphopichia burtonii NRRL Y-1933]
MSKLRNNSQTLFPTLDEKSLRENYIRLEERFKLASSVNDLSQLLNEIDVATQDIDLGLNQYSAIQLKKHQQEITNIELNRAKLSSAITNSNELNNIFSSANNLGHSLTYKIKSLDLEIGNVNKTLNFVTDIQTLKNNINQANYAIEHKNWILASQCINTVNNKLDNKLVNGEFASVVIPSTDIPELPNVTVKKWTEQLTEVFQNNFNESATKRDIPELTKYFQLFPLIGQEEIGLNCYSKFIRSIISDTSRALVNSASSTGDGPKSGLFATISMQLFENVSVMISQHAPLINRYYGSTYPNAIQFVISKIQQEIDSQIGLITDSFYDLKRVEKILQDTKLHKFLTLKKRAGVHFDQNNNSNQQGQEDEAEFVSIVEVGDLINEFASIFHHWALYCKFITINYFSDSKSESDKQQEDLKLPDLLLNSSYTKKIHKKYITAFESLYKFYFRRSLEKAITIEELPPLDSCLIISNDPKSPDQVPVSSVIEDFALVLHSVLRNIVDCGQSTSVKNFINDCLPVMKNDLINGFLIKSINDNPPRYNATLSLVASSTSQNGPLSNNTSPGISRSNTPALESNVAGTGMGFFKGASSALGNVVGGASGAAAGLATTTSNNTKLTNFVIYLNTIAMGQEYMTKIFQNITKGNLNSLKSIYPFGKNNEQVFNILKNELVEPFNTILGKIILDSLINFYNQSLKNKIIGFINEMFPDTTDSAYIIYSSNSLNDTSSILKFTNSWQSLIRPYKQSFHKSLIYDKLCRLLVVNVANLIEKKLTMVLNKFRINELGALKLEKDLSFIINEVCEDNYELREKFLRLTQLVLLIGMDEDEYELSIQNKPPKDDNNEDEDDIELLGINWVLTPQERNQFRKYRI